MPTMAAAEEVLETSIADAAANYTSDPYLDIIPAFSYSMPSQVLLLGITLALLCVLLFHLLFTLRYHFPLSKYNYTFQIVAVSLAIAYSSVSLGYTFQTLLHDSRMHPYMFDYIEVRIPADSWTEAQKIVWWTLQLVMTIAVHVTHIHFLTLLFPSALEAKLIFVLLGPLALLSSFLIYTNLSGNDASRDLGDAIRNISNSTLTLLYTSGLLIWGLFVNRRRAWRTDGGTATFGAMALFFGLLGTVVNFLEISEDRMLWLNGIVITILLWQCWVGFWWWVGAGMWSGEAADVERREAKKRARREAKRRRKEERKRQRKLAASATGVDATAGRGTAASTISQHAATIRRRLGGAGPVSNSGTAAPESIEMRSMNGGEDQERAPSRRAATDIGARSSSASSTSTPTTIPYLWQPLAKLFSPWFSRLRTAHQQETAARAALPSALPDDIRRVWGLQGLTNRGRQERGQDNASRRGAARVDREDVRAGFVSAGAAPLQDEDLDAASRTMRRDAESTEWEDVEDEGVPADGRRRRHRHRRPPSTAVREQDAAAALAAERQWRGRGMEARNRWWYKGIVGRMRLRDVSTF